MIHTTLRSRLLAFAALALSLIGAFLPWEHLTVTVSGSPAGFLDLHLEDHLLFAMSLVLGLWCALGLKVSKWLLTVPAIVATACLVMLTARRQGVVIWDGMDAAGNMTGGSYAVVPGPGAWCGLAAGVLYLIYGVVQWRKRRRTGERTTLAD